MIASVYRLGDERRRGRWRACNNGYYDETDCPSTDNGLGLLILADRKTLGNNDDARERSYMDNLNDDLTLAGMISNLPRMEQCRRLNGSNQVKGQAKGQAKGGGSHAHQEPVLKRDNQRKVSAPAGHLHSHRIDPASQTVRWTNFVTRFLAKAAGRTHRKWSRSGHRTGSVGDSGSASPSMENGVAPANDPLSLFQLLEKHLAAVNAAEPRRKSSHYSVLRRPDDLLQFTMISDKPAESITILSEYFQRLTCYQAMPAMSESIIIDTSLTVHQTMTVLLRHHRSISAVLYDGHRYAVVDVDFLVASLWHLYEEHPPSSTDSTMTTDFFQQPVGECCPPEQQTWNVISPDSKLTEAARLLRRKNAHQSRALARRLAVFDEVAGDILHLLSVDDILYYLSKQLCKFDLVSAFDQTLISTIRHVNWTTNSDRRLQIDTSVRTALSKLTTDRILPVFRKDDVFETIVTMTDLTDFLLTHGWNETTLVSKTVQDVLAGRDHKMSVAHDSKTALSTVLRTMAGSTPQFGELPYILIKDDDEVVVGLLEPEDILSAVLFSIDDDVQSHYRRDSGVGDELQSDDPSKI